LHSHKSTPIRFLEIGTYDAVNITSLASSFSDVHFVTYDLPSSNSIFKSTYGRSDSCDEFTRRRDKLLSLYPNVTFIEHDSISLTTQRGSIPTNQSYDIIWIDGAHGYPQCAVDITNAFALVSSGGWILCDDVILSGLSIDDPFYRSYAAYSTLSAFIRHYALSDSFLLPKRIGSNTKFVAAVRVP
jgi:hypothetical protein